MKCQLALLLVSFMALTTKAVENALLESQMHQAEAAEQASIRPSDTMIDDGALSDTTDPDRPDLIPVISTPPESLPSSSSGAVVANAVAPPVTLDSEPSRLRGDGGGGGGVTPANAVVGGGHLLPSDVVVDAGSLQSYGGGHHGTSFYGGEGPYTHDDHDYPLPNTGGDALSSESTQRCRGAQCTPCRGLQCFSRLFTSIRSMTGRNVLPEQPGLMYSLSSGTPLGSMQGRLSTIHEGSMESSPPNSFAA